jgi:hypothetical protein
MTTAIAMIRILLCAALLAGATGCARLTIDPAAGAETVLLRSIDAAPLIDIQPLPPPQGGVRVYREAAWWLLWGGLPLNHPNLSRHMEDTLPPGTVAMNLRTRVSQRWYGWLLNIGTLGIVDHRVVEHRYEPGVVNRREGALRDVTPGTRTAASPGGA